MTGEEAWFIWFIIIIWFMGIGDIPPLYGLTMPESIPAEVCVPCHGMLHKCEQSDEFCTNLGRGPDSSWET
jgi:hypothetical protein